MLDYNTQLKKLALPEYGRNIQQMVDYCCKIEDREERTGAPIPLSDQWATCFHTCAMKPTTSINCGTTWPS